MRGQGRGVFLATLLLVTAFGCAVDELVGALDTVTADGGTTDDGGWRRDGGSRDDGGGDGEDAGDDLILVGAGGDAGTAVCPVGCRLNCFPAPACDMLRGSPAAVSR